MPSVPPCPINLIPLPSLPIAFPPPFAVKARQTNPPRHPVGAAAMPCTTGWVSDSSAGLLDPANGAPFFHRSEDGEHQ